MSQPHQSSPLVYFVGVLGAMLIVGALVLAMKSYTQPPPVNQGRVAERKKALTETRAEDAKSLGVLEWVNQPNGIVRLPITNAMEATVKEYQAGAFHTNLQARVTKASFVPPPPNYE